MTEVYCYSLECRFNDGKYKCRKRPAVNIAADGDVPFSVMVGPYWVCNDYEEGDKNANNT
jgi:hypothetical protein